MTYKLVHIVIYNRDSVELMDEFFTFFRDEELEVKIAQMRGFLERQKNVEPFIYKIYDKNEHLKKVGWFL